MSKTYAGNVKAVDNVNLKIEPGSVNDFLGLNGADKTTTIKLITGVLQADAGRITVGGNDIQTADLEAKNCIGFVPDNPDAFLSLGVLAVQIAMIVNNVWGLPLRQISNILTVFQ